MDSMIRVVASHFRGGPHKGMTLEGYYIYDETLRMKVVLDFRRYDRRLYGMERWLSVLKYILTTSGYSFRMTREQFININIKRELFPGVEINTKLEGF